MVGDGEDAAPPGGVRINLLPSRSLTRDAERAHRLAVRLNALPEATMRGAVLAEQLAALPVPSAAAVIAILVQRGRQGGPPYELALGGLEELLREARLPYELLVELYRELKLRTLGEAAALLLPGRDSRTVLGAPAPQMPGSRELTLGERKSLARAAPRDTIARLLRDPEPMVIRLLLKNPRLLERDLVFLASRRPISAEVVREILGARKWATRYAVRRALVLNPSVPNEIALRLLPMLVRQHLREVSVDPALPPVRVEAAQRLLASGRQGSAPPPGNDEK